MNLETNFDAIGKAFADQYYKLFDANRAELKMFYRGDSMLTFEGVQMQGEAAIVQKLQASQGAFHIWKCHSCAKSLPFQTVQHVITTVDCQPTANFGVLIHVLGQLKTDNDPPHSFSQTFVLKQEPPKQYYCFNDVFRLSLHHG